MRKQKPFWELNLNPITMKPKEGNLHKSLGLPEATIINTKQFKVVI